MCKKALLPTLFIHVKIQLGILVEHRFLFLKRNKLNEIRHSYHNHFVFVSLNFQAIRIKVNHKTHSSFDNENTQVVLKCADCGYIITEPLLKCPDACPVSISKPHVINGWHVLTEAEVMTANIDYDHG